jgi:hypothetical protein
MGCDRDAQMFCFMPVNHVSNLKVHSFSISFLLDIIFLRSNSATIHCACIGRLAIFTFCLLLYTAHPATL